jgi:putative flippase GtrA
MAPDDARAVETLVDGPLAPAGRRPIDIARRTATGVTKPHNWMQLVKFGIVGGSGYVVNLVVFAGLFQGLGIHHLLAAVGAFCVAVSNNFIWNRYWTFGAGEGVTAFQAPRFFAVSVGSLVVNLIALQLFVTVADMNEVSAQALAVAIAMPFNFIGNKLWTFSPETLERG